MSKLYHTVVHLRIKNKDKAKFYKTCKKQGHIPADVMRKLITDYAEGQLEYPKPALVRSQL